jgi:hypothetical protein
MDAPVNYQPTKWTTFLKEFAEAPQSAQETQTKLQQLIQHIPAIYREVHSSAASLTHLRTIINITKSSPASKASSDKLAERLNELRPGLVSMVKTEESQLPSNANSANPLTLANWNAIRNDDWSHNFHSDKLKKFLDAYLTQFSDPRDRKNNLDLLNTIVGNLLYCKLQKNSSALLAILGNFLEKLSAYTRLDSIENLHQLTVKVLTHPEFSGVASSRIWTQINLFDNTPTITFPGVPIKDPSRPMNMSAREALSAFQRDMIYVAAAVMQDPKFKKDFKDFLSQIWNQISKIPTQDWDKEQVLIKLFIRVCASLAKIDPSLLPESEHLKELVSGSAKVKLKDGGVSVKAYQLQFLYALMLCKHEKPSWLDLTQTTISKDLFKRMLEAFFNKGNSEYRFSTPELIEIYEFLSEHTTNINGQPPVADNHALRAVRAQILETFPKRKLFDPEQLEGFLRLKKHHNPQLRNVSSEIEANQIATIHFLSPYKDGKIIYDLLGTLSGIFPEAIDQIKSDLDRIDWNWIIDNDHSAEKIRSYLYTARASFRLAIANKEKFNYQSVSALLTKAYRLPNQEESVAVMKEIKDAFPDLHTKEVSLKSVDDDFLEFNETPQIELSMTDQAIDPKRFECLAGLNITKITFTKSSPEITEIHKKFPSSTFVYVEKEKEPSLGDKFLALFGKKHN